jgi:hypothetical protein
MRERATAYGCERNSSSLFGRKGPWSVTFWREAFLSYIHPEWLDAGQEQRDYISFTRAGKCRGPLSSPAVSNFHIGMENRPGGRREQAAQQQEMVGRRVHRILIIQPKTKNRTLSSRFFLVRHGFRP